MSAQTYAPVKEWRGAKSGVVMAQARSRSRKARPRKSARAPSGEMLAVIDLASQRIRVYDSTGEIMQAPVSSGMAGHRTPKGIFSVLQKRRWHESNIYSGAPMPFMQRLTWSGIALHAGHLPGYPASHGCIRMPSGFASRLFSATKMGMRVVVASGRASVRPITHPALPTPLMVVVPVTPNDGNAAAVGGRPVQVATSGNPTTDGPQPGAALPATRLSNPMEQARLHREKAKTAAAESVTAAKAALAAARRAADEADHAEAEAGAASRAVEIAEVRLAKLREAEQSAVPEEKARAMQARIDAATRLADLQRALKEAEGLAAALRPASFDAAVKSREADEERERAEAEARASRAALHPLAVLISRKTGKIHVRQGYQPIFEAPVTIKSADQPLGTHLYLAIAANGATGQVQWRSVTVPERSAWAGTRKPVRRGHRDDDERRPPSDAREALDRIELAPGVRSKLAERLWVGASIIVTDHGISNETGEYTDFIVLTR
ncbi:MAG: L,D-transpeptidase family protein [Hyphomicrobiaceae bacterium]